MIKRVPVTLMIEINSKDHNDPQPTATEVREHVLREINTAGGQFDREDWRRAIKASLVNKGRG